MSKETATWTVGALLSWTKDYFTSRRIESPRLDAEVLLGHVLEKERIYLYVHFEDVVTPSQLATFRELVKRRAKYEPIAYILGEKEFMGHMFSVKSGVLIPRPDTEILVMAMAERLKKMIKDDKTPIHFADIGTGSGAILLSLLKELPQAKGIGVDISPLALEVARENVVRLELEDRAELREGDLLAPLDRERLDRERFDGKKFHAIISNPPYIRSDEMESLAPDILAYEPREALTDEGDGLSYYRRLLQSGKDYLVSGGYLAMEVGHRESQDVVELAKHEGWQDIECVKDYAGVERVVICRQK